MKNNYSQPDVGYGNIIIQTNKYRLKKGEIEVECGYGHDVPIALICLDSIGLPLDEFCENYNVRFEAKVYDDLKKLGY